MTGSVKGGNQRRSPAISADPAIEHRKAHFCDVRHDEVELREDINEGHHVMADDLCRAIRPVVVALDR